MDRGTRTFWLVVALLLGASCFFGFRAESVRRSVQRASAPVQTGDLLSLSQAQDGDTVLLVNTLGQGVTVRIIGIKSFDATAAHDPTTPYAKEAVAALERALAGKPVRLMLGTPPRDAHGRTLATLFVDDVDVGLELVRAGRVIVYTPFPFPMIGEYLRAQAEAEAARRGLWAEQIVADRARALIAQWKRGTP